MRRIRKNSVQRLIGFEGFNKYGVRTEKAEFVFFAVEPTNISVLSAVNIEMKIHRLMLLLSMFPELELLALDSCECFDSNKAHLKKRLDTEENENIRRLLEADYDFLDEIQTEMASARQFLFAVRFRREKEESIFKLLNRTEKAIAEHGFSARRLGKSDIKRMLALYFATSAAGEEIPDIEGENYLEMECESNV